MLKATLVFLFIGVACSARVQLTDVKAVLNEYLSQRISSMGINPKMRAAPDSQACYDKYLPLIQEAFEEGAEDSKVCTVNADSDKQAELKKVEGDRKTLDGNVETVQKSLSACVEESDVIAYLSCLSGSSETNQEAIKNIGDISGNLLDALESKFEEIDEIEVGCVTGSIEAGKEQADIYIDMMVNCVLYGETTTTTTTEATTTTEETTVATTPEESGESTPGGGEEVTPPEESGESTPGGSAEVTPPEESGESTPEGSGEVGPPEESGEVANPNESNPENHPESDL